MAVSAANLVVGKVTSSAACNANERGDIERQLYELGVN